MTRVLEYSGAALAAATAVDPDLGPVARTEYSWDPVDGRPVGAHTALSEQCAADAYNLGPIASICAPDEFAATETSWTSAGRRTKFIDGEGHTTKWAHDPSTGRVLSRFGETIESHFEYGPSGLLTKIIDGPLAAPVRRSDRIHDPRGRLERSVWKELPSGSSFAIEHAFDLVGRPVWSEARRNGSVTEETYRDYDSLGRVTQIAQNIVGTPSPGPITPGCDVGELCFDYDTATRVSRTTYPDGRAVSFEYTGPLLGQVCEGLSCSTGRPLQEVLSRDVLGRPVETWRTGDVFETTMYDGMGRPDLQELHYANPTGAPGSGAMLVTIDPEYDALDRETSRVVDHLGSEPLAAFGELRSWTYNAAGWLTSETTDATTTLFDWNRAGSRVGTVDLSTSESTDAVYGPDNRLDRIDRFDARGNLLSQTAFAYDALGRRLNDEESRALEYAPHGRLERVIDPSSGQLTQWNFGHDGRRVTEQGPGGPRSFRFGPESFEPFVVTEVAGDRNDAQLGGATFGALEPMGGPGGLVTQQAGLAGVASIATDADGEVIWQGKWDAWGSPTMAEGAAPPTGWRGLMPSGAGVPFLAAAMRDYDPTTGTWLQPDPIGVDGGANIYGYADGDPVNRSDPSGLCTPSLTAEARAQHLSAYVERTMDEFSGSEVEGPNKGGAIFAQGTCDQRCFAGLAWQSAMMALKPGVNEARAARANKAGTYRNQVLAVAAQRGMTEADVLAAEAADPTFGDQITGLAFALSSYDMAMDRWFARDGGFDLRRPGISGGPAHIFLDTPAVYLTGRVPSERYANALASNYIPVGDGVWVPDDGPIYWASFAPLEVCAGGTCATGGGSPAPASETRMSGATVTANRGLETFAVAYHSGDVSWSGNDWETMFPGQPRPAFRHFEGELWKVDVAMRNRNPSLRTVAEGAPGAIYSTAVDFGSGVNGLAGGAAGLLGLDVVEEHFEEASDLGAGHADRVGDANFQATALHPEDGEVVGRIGFEGGLALLGETAVFGRAGRVPETALGPTNWNEFQAATAGRFGSRAEAGAAWAYYKAYYGLDKATTSVQATSGGAEPVLLGQAGESAVRGAHSIGQKVLIRINGRHRIPDGLTGTTVSEVKNVSSLTYTRQLRDFADYAQAQGLQFDLYVRQTTVLSSPLIDAIVSGQINLRYIP